LRDFGLGITNGKIAALIPPQDLAQVTATQVVSLDDHVVLPGFVNAHAHSAMVLLRGLANDLPIITWLEKHIFPLEAQFVSAEFVRDGTELAIAEMIQSGTTCFNDHYFFPEEAVAAAQKAKMRANIGLWVADIPTNWGKGPEDYFSYFLKAMETPPPNLIQYALAPHGPYIVSDDAFKRVVALAEQYDLPIHAHIHESEEEIRRSLKQYGKRPLARLHELGVLSQRLQAVHMTQITEEDWPLLERVRPHITTCPESNLKLASGFAPIQKFLERGLNVSLGTDGAVSNNDLDMLSETRTLALLSKGVAGDATVLGAHEALKIATLNGAKAMGLDHKIGSLLPGKDADIMAINLNDFSTLPTYNPITQVVYSAGRHQITHVWVQGEALMSERKLLTCDVEEVKAIARKWEEKIVAVPPLE
jgi:5-methylthioadenosine/S-adenosylhomocysteine deaminase